MGVVTERLTRFVGLHVRFAHSSLAVHALLRLLSHI